MKAAGIGITANRDQLDRVAQFARFVSSAYKNPTFSKGYW
jgi:hypothetical protein